MSFEPTEAELTGRAFMSLSEPAKALWLRAGFWCDANRERLISLAMLKGWGSAKRAADELVAAGFWATMGDDWLAPERAESLSAKRARAGRAGGLAKASKRPSKTVANALANEICQPFASLAKPGLPEFASETLANPAGSANFASDSAPNLVLPHTPSPDSDSGSSDLSDLRSPSFQHLSKPNRSRAREPKPAPRRCRRCPEGFELNETGQKLCAELRVNWALEGPKFRDWEFKDPKSDWQATARTWIRNAAARGAPTGAIRNGRVTEANPNLDHDTRAALAASRRVQELTAGLK